LSFRSFTYSLLWNLLLITSGSFLLALALKAIAQPHNFVPGGVFGVAVVCHQLWQNIDIGVWYILLNIPLFVLAYCFISKRFLAYSSYAMLLAGLLYEWLPWHFQLDNQLYAAITSGALMGAGAGMVLRSLGSNGGLDVISVILYQRFNLGMGRFFFIFNLGLFAFCFFIFDPDTVIASLILVGVSAFAIDQTLSSFNQRKLVFIVSNRNEGIADDILAHLGIGATFLEGVGAYQRSRKHLLMAVINNIQLKRLEQIVFEHDPYALFIVENTFNVIGSTFSKRKIY